MSRGEPAAEPSAAPRKKKKRRALPAEAEGEARAAAAEEAPERAAFLEGFPSDPELDVLVAAFEEGNYALVRERAPRLASSSDREEVRRAALELRRRIDPDPLTIYLLLTAFALLAVLSVWYWTHKHV